MTRMNRDFEGLLNLQGFPGALFVIDSFNESIAVAEANRLKIPVSPWWIVIPTLPFFPIPFPVMMILQNLFESLWMYLDAIQAGIIQELQAPTKRKDITPVSQEPDFLDNEDEPEVTLA